MCGWIETLLLVQCEIMLALDASRWRSLVNGPRVVPTCVIPPHPALLEVSQLIRHTIITGSSWITILWSGRDALIWNPLSFFFFQAGLIRTDNGEFFIEPLEKGQQDVEVKGRVHVVYRRSAIKRETGQRREDLHNEGRQRSSSSSSSSDVSGNIKHRVRLCVCVCVLTVCGCVGVYVWVSAHRRFITARTVR